MSMVIPTPNAYIHLKIENEEVNDQYLTEA
jgi:hypothetical protein